MGYRYDSLDAAMGLFGGMVVGFVVVAFIIAIAAYVVSSLAYMKVFRRCGENVVAAWIPFWRDWTIASCACAGEENVSLYGLICPSLVLKLYWLIQGGLSFILSGSSVGNLLAYLVGAAFLGQIFTTLYARFEEKTEEECRVIGVLSGLFPIIAWIKFLSMKDGQSGPTGRRSYGE